MQKGFSRAVRAAEKLLRALEERGIRVREAYLFGSYVRGDWIKTSDVDLIIVSEYFRGLGFMERLDLVERVQWEENIQPHVEAIPLTPEELSERIKSGTVVRDASRYWIRIR